MRFIRFGVYMHDNQQLAAASIDQLLDEVRGRYKAAQTKASLAEQSKELHPIQEAGNRIRAARKEQGLTQSELCDLSGVGYGTLNKIENGHPSVRLDVLLGVTHALGLKLWIG